MPPAKTKASHRKAITDAMPAFISPCLATLAREAPQGELWVHEIKYDGYRMQAHVEAGEVRMYTRKGLDWTSRFAGITKALSKLGASRLFSMAKSSSKMSMVRRISPCSWTR